MRAQKLLKQATLGLLITISLCITFEVQAQEFLYGPQSPPPKDASITFTGTASDGQIGFAGGKTFTFTNVILANSTTVYWTMIENSVVLSMDGGYPYTAQEILDYDQSQSDLSQGVVVWTGSTQIPVSNGTGYVNQAIISKFIMTITSEGASANLVDPVALGLDVQSGGVVNIPAFNYVFEVNFAMFVSDNAGTTWVPHLEYYNNAATPPAIEGAYSEFNFGFYWENDPPEIETNDPASVDEGDTVRITSTVLEATDVESPQSDIIFIVDPALETTLPAHGALYINDVMINPGDTITMEQIVNDKFEYIHDGSESIIDSIPFFVFDSDSAQAFVDGDSLIYFMLNITPVDDPPTLVLNNTATIDENSVLTLSKDHLFATDPESDSTNVFYILDQDSNSDYPLNGLIKFSGVPLSDGGTFSQSDLNEGKVTYEHDGSETLTDGFLFRVVDEFGHLADIDDNVDFFFNIDITTLNDDPQLTKNTTLVIDEGGTGVVGNMVLAAIDEESDPVDITFTLDPNSELSEPNFGEVYLDGVLLDDGEGFTMADVNNNLVTYVHDGSEGHADFFLFNVSDPHGGVAHDGDFTLFHFNVAVNNVNDPPTLANPIEDFKTRAEENLDFTIPENTFEDVDDGDEFSYLAKQDDESALPEWISFDTETGKFSGTPQVADIGIVSIVLIARDIAGDEASDLFDIEVISPVGIAQTGTTSLVEIGPNPFNTVFTIRLNDEYMTGENIEIYNMLGKKILIPVEKSEREFEVDISDQPSGIYFIHLKTEGRMIIEKIIKK